MRARTVRKGGPTVRRTRHRTDGKAVSSRVARRRIEVFGDFATIVAAGQHPKVTGTRSDTKKVVRFKVEFSSPRITDDWFTDAALVAAGH